MLDKIFSIFGFSGSKNYVGLAQLVETENQIKPEIKKAEKKELKLSDLMRGN